MQKQQWARNERNKEWKILQNASMANDQSQEQQRGHQRGFERREDSSFSYAGGHLSSVISKNSELEPKFQEYKGRVVFRGDIVKDDSGSLYLRSRVGQLHKRRPQKLRMFLQGYQDAQDKQPMQCPLTPKSTWRTVQHCCNGVDLDRG